MKIWAILILVLALAVIGTAACIGYDIFRDRQHTVLTDGSVPAYTDWQPYPTKEMKPIFMLPPKTSSKVKRIRYGKDYMAIKVESQNSQVGWIFSGQPFKLKKAK